jgi:putative hydrolase of the HAD superfamily
MIKCVIFDLDDTLYPEIEYCKSGMLSISKILAKKLSLSSEGVFEKIWSRFLSGDRDMLFNKILDEFGYEYDQSFILELIGAYRGHMPDIVLPIESESVLKELSREYTLALLSDGFMPAQRLKVDSLGIKDYFKEIVFSDELGREFWKPSTVGFEKILVNLNIAPEMAVYVGDNIKKDFIAPNKLGMHSIQYCRKEKIHKDIEVNADALPECRVDNLGEIAQQLKLWGKRDV